MTKRDFQYGISPYTKLYQDLARRQPDTSLYEVMPLDPLVQVILAYGHFDDFHRFLTYYTADGVDNYPDDEIVDDEAASLPRRYEDFPYVPGYAGAERREWLTRWYTRAATEVAHELNVAVIALRAAYEEHAPYPEHVISGYVSALIRQREITVQQDRIDKMETRDLSQALFTPQRR